MEILYYIQKTNKNLIASWLAIRDGYVNNIYDASLFTGGEFLTLLKKYDKKDNLVVWEQGFILSIKQEDGRVLKKDLLRNAREKICTYCGEKAMSTVRQAEEGLIKLSGIKLYEDVTKFSQTSDERIMEQSKPKGTKHDQGKPDYSLLPVRPIFAIVEILTFGVEKYSRDNWQEVEDPINRYTAAMYRHIEAWRGGEKVDIESGKHHLAHAGCCLLFLLWFELKGDKNE